MVALTPEWKRELIARCLADVGLDLRFTGSSRFGSFVGPFEGHDLRVLLRPEPRFFRMVLKIRHTVRPRDHLLYQVAASDASRGTFLADITVDEDRVVLIADGLLLNPKHFAIWLPEALSYLLVGVETFWQSVRERRVRRS